MYNIYTIYAIFELYDIYTISKNIYILHLNREKGYAMQRKFAPWIGASLMGSFETYHKTLKITRQEWEENPDIVLNTKCI